MPCDQRRPRQHSAAARDVDAVPAGYARGPARRHRARRESETDGRLHRRRGRLLRRLHGTRRAHAPTRSARHLLPAGRGRLRPSASGRDRKGAGLLTPCANALPRRPGRRQGSPTGCRTQGARTRPSCGRTRRRQHPPRPPPTAARVPSSSPPAAAAYGRTGAVKCPTAPAASRGSAVQVQVQVDDSRCEDAGLGQGEKHPALLAGGRAGCRRRPRKAAGPRSAHGSQRTVSR